MSAALLIDFGSTYTKLRAVDLDTGTILGAGQGPSTVTTDINEGLDAALVDLERRLGGLPEFTYRLASSSAAGGLAMITVGLVKELTAEAARLAALGAGAKLIDARAYKLTDKDAASIVAAAPDILLLAGGTDGGNEETIRWNAEKLTTACIDCPVIIAGNRNAADDIAADMTAAGVDARIAGNVMPEFNVLDVEPARAAIRDVFIERIVHAKGIDKAADRFDAVLMPTPAAVMEGARLIADGTSDRPGIGPLVVVDVGGATTDVHSIADGTPTDEGVLQYGLPEPHAKRTVEGDLGMRHNARSIVETVGDAAFADTFAIPVEDIAPMLEAIAADAERLPETTRDIDFDMALATVAVSRAMRRHAGTLEIKQSVSGPVAVQTGKDLTRVGALVGTGGVLVHGEHPERILRAALFDSTDAASLRPRSPRLLIDKDYALYAVGLLAQVDPAAATRLADNTLKQLSPSFEDTKHGRSPAA